MVEKLEKTRDEITDDFLVELPGYMQHEFLMFMEGFNACLIASKVESVPMDYMDMCDEYMEAVKRRATEEDEDGMHDA